jgi:hypothetical protein
MSTFHVEIDLEPQGSPTPTDVEQMLDAVLIGLADDNRIIDPDYVAALAEGSVAITMTVKAETVASAHDMAVTSIEDAIARAEVHALRIMPRVA